MSRRMSRRVTPVNEPQPPRSEKPSSEIDVDEVLRLAKEADEAAQAEPEPTRKRVRKQPVNGQAQPAEAIQTIEPDPEFIGMCQWGVGSVVEIANKKLDWSDPGIHWKEKVATIVARIINRIQPMEPSLTTDLIIVSGYVALWALPNVSANIEAKRAAKNKNALGNNRQREDIQDAGATSPS